MKKLQRLTIILGLITIVIIAGLNLTNRTSDADELSKTETMQLLDMFSNSFQMIRQDYVENIDDEQLIKAAIQGMLSSLDPHSVYLDDDRYQDMRTDTKGEFGGLGIEVTMDKSGFVKVVSPIDDTPAAKAGILAGDYITHLDGTPVQGLNLSQAVEKMRGLVGEEIVITIARRDSEPFDVKIIRAKIQIRSVKNRTDDNIGYIRLSRFSQQTQPGLEKAIGQINKKIGDDLIGYVLDLRNNPGGLLSQAISVSDSFLDQGMIVSTKGRHDGDSQVNFANKGDLANGLPIIILINSGSASASEIVAGALQDHGRAIILGTTSFGKGSVQTIKPLMGTRAAIKLTTQRYYTPSGRSIQATGIIPDVIVQQARIEKFANNNSRHEADLINSLKNENKETNANDIIKKELSVAEEEENRIALLIEKDYQLSRAYDLLRGISVYKKSSKSN